MDLDAYRGRSETFVGELNLAYYRHFAGLDGEFAVEAVYDRHAVLFTRAAVEELRVRAGSAPDTKGDARRRARMLLAFAIEGHIGRETRALDAELARREASLALRLDGTDAPMGFRESAVAQANEPDPDRRAGIEAARLAATEAELNPLAREALERTHAVAAALGWSTYRAMCEELHGVDLLALGRQTAAFAAATDARYADVVEAPLRRATGLGLAEMRRCDLPRFFRGAEADARFPPAGLIGCLEATMAALGIDAARQPGVVVDVERRPAKSPRAFCAPVRVPGEIYLVVPPVGGRDDYVALLHEAGHTQHYAHVDPALPFEFRCLGDNSVTEAFAFLFDRLVDEPGWLDARLGVRDADGALTAHARAERLIYLRRYGAKLAYELALHGEPAASLEGLPDHYAAQLSGALRITWPRETWLTDVDPGFYAANYLRAWALETRLRSMLRERFGATWFAEPAAGDVLRALWRDGQRLDAEELCERVCGMALDFGAVLAEFERP